MKKKIDYEIGSGNVFADLGFPDAEERLAKVELAYQINSLIAKKKLNQMQAAKLLDIDQPKISLLSQGKLAGFSLERLFRFLTILGQDVTIKISKARSKSKANVSVTIPSTKKRPVIRRQENTYSRTLQAKKNK
ncbi:MAG TPA: helix-turn-helix transcriptional regulator [Candidatus Limnocylindria bacterium]|nr:helix-turn-helix transcriptional regulator [Candidatus Limnocylindria bacterium]